MEEIATLKYRKRHSKRVSVRNHKGPDANAI